MRIKNGFTLIEIMVVTAILATMITIAIAVLNPLGQFQKAQDVKRKSDLAQIQRALEAYYQDWNQYPLSSTDGRFEIIDGSAGEKSWGSAWQPYMNILPKDPTSDKNYVYYSDGQSYYLYASLDRVDSALCARRTVRDPCASIGNENLNRTPFPAATSCGSSFICNFGVSTPNVNP